VRALLPDIQWASFFVLLDEPEMINFIMYGSGWLSILSFRSPA